MHGFSPCLRSDIGIAPWYVNRIVPVETLLFDGDNADPSDDVYFDVQLGTTTRFDQDASADWFAGSGNLNGSFTVSQTQEPAHDIELALRGKLRFNEFNAPENTFNSNGDGTYSFENDIAPGGFGFDPGSPTTPVWSFEWSINTDVSGTTGADLNDLTYLLEIDGDPSAGTDFGTLGGFDPINLPYADHAIGDFSTTDGTNEVVAADPAAYTALIDSKEVAQNSWNYELFNEPTDGFFLDQLAAFDPTDEGVYTIRLSAFDGGELVNQVSIDIIVTDFA